SQTCLQRRCPMFEKFSDVAERVATRVSRRGFIGSLGRWAVATAMGLAGVLTIPGSAHAGAKKTHWEYFDANPLGHFTLCGRACVALGASCPLPPSSCGAPFVEVSSHPVKGCQNCKY